MSGLDQTNFGRLIGQARDRGPYHRATVAKWESGESIPDLLDFLLAADLAGISARTLLYPGEDDAELYQHGLKLEHLRDRLDKMEITIARLNMRIDRL